ncbi:MAG TPA: response regulator, partial [Dehalococcoidia bacterium]|nr:response regulator [Dehalococcoidia bacterium]
GPSILVVDDDPGIVGFLELALIDEGYAVRVAANGREALKQIAEFCPNLILLDMNMPVMDGWEFCQRLRSRGTVEGSIPIVVMTAARDAADRSRDVGAQAFLGKPFDLDHLFRVISSLLKTD